MANEQPPGKEIQNTIAQLLRFELSALADAHLNRANSCMFTGVPGKDSDEFIAQQRAKAKVHELLLTGIEWLIAKLPEGSNDDCASEYQHSDLVRSLMDALHTHDECVLPDWITDPVKLQAMREKGKVVAERYPLPAYWSEQTRQNSRINLVKMLNDV